MVPLRANLVHMLVSDLDADLSAVLNDWLGEDRLSRRCPGSITTSTRYHRHSHTSRPGGASGPVIRYGVFIKRVVSIPA